MSAPCAFILPVATLPNAIVFDTGEIHMQDMIKSGIILNIVGVILITVYIYLVGALFLILICGCFLTGLSKDHMDI